VAVNDTELRECLEGFIKRGGRWPEPPPAPYRPPDPLPPRLAYFLGIDLGELKDPSCLILVERRLVDRDPAQYRLRDLIRWPLRTPYPTIVSQVVAYLTRSAREGRPVLAEADTWVVVDGTGVGRPVWEMVVGAHDLRDLRQRGRLRAVTITGGSSAGYDPGASTFNVPKKDLVGAIQAVLGTGRLKVSSALPLAVVLRKELDVFTAKVSSRTGHESFEAWRERDHDDAVLALALALWQALRAPDGASEEPVKLVEGWRGVGAGDPAGPASAPVWLDW
jgi:hypothetical protein